MNDETEGRQQREAGGSFISVGGLLTAASLVGVMLALLGYGVAISAESRFGIPRAQLFETTTDLLDLSTWAILDILAKGFGIFGSLSLYKEMVRGALPAAILLIVAWLAIAWVVPWRARRKSAAESEAMPPRPKSFLTALKASWWMPVGAFLIPGFMLVGVLAIVTAIAGLATIPLVGMSAGEAHIDKYVVGAENCVPVKDRFTRLKQQDSARKKPPSAPGANCVAITFTEGDRHLQGRVVFALSKAILLYDPATGSVKRVPTEGAIVEVISSL